MKNALIAVVCGLPLALGACSATPVKQAAQRDIQPFDIQAKTDPIGFTRAVVDIRRGTQLGSFRADLAHCAMMGQNKITWGSGRMNASSIELADVFFHEMTAAGYDVANSPNNMFAAQAKADQSRVMYQVAGRISEIQLDLCGAQNIWTGWVEGIEGDAYVKVHWQALDVLTEKVVFETVTEGTFKNTTATMDGDVVALHGAFANAVANLAADKGFLALVTSGADDHTSLSDKGTKRLVVIPLTEPEIQVPVLPTRAAPIGSHMEDVRAATVLIHDATGHGSGFLVSEDGLILTNAHVVGGKRKVKVRLKNGDEHLGDVIRVHEQRDVALVRLPPGRYRALPIRPDVPKVGEEIYAVGAPFHVELSHTVTRGIVSSYFEEERTTLRYIQGDVTIHPGNSGGPLLDSKGNLVGISVAGFVDTRTGGSANLNLFIPIHDGMRMIRLATADAQG